MTKIVEQILVKADQKAVYNTYSNILLWKKVLKDVIAIKIISDCEAAQEFYYTIRKGDAIETVRTIRKRYPPNKIEMEQLDTPPGFKTMKGIWKFDVTQEGTIVTATRFVDFDETANVEQALYMLKMMLKRNLISFKQYLEVNRFSVTQVIPAPIHDVYELFWNIKEWQRIWYPISAVRIISEDNRHQVFQMDVSMNGINEQIETKRIREDNKIKFYSNKPVSIFERHEGEWSFEEIDDKHTRVIASRYIKFYDDYPMEGRTEYIEKFQKRVEHILITFKKYFIGLTSKSIPGEV